MTTRSPILVAVAAGLALVVTACGGDDEGRPSRSEISEVFQGDTEAGEGLSEAQADCIADAYADSDISDEGVRTIIEADDSVQTVADLDLSEADAEAHEAVLEELTQCGAVG